MFRYSMLLAAIACLAQDRERPSFIRPSFIRMSPVLAAIDADKDGVISSAEVKASAKAVASADRNGDGKLTGDELRPAFGRGGPGGRGPGGPGGPGQDPSELIAMVLRFDANGDGAVTKEEMPERMQGMFGRGDTNKDGKLSREEVTALAQSQRPGGGDGPGREGGRGERKGPPGGPGGPPRDPATVALDANGDGEIGADEAANAPAALAKLDKNGDGQLTDDEVRPEFGRGPGGPERQGPRR